MKHKKIKNPQTQKHMKLGPKMPKMPKNAPIASETAFSTGVFVSKTAFFTENGEKCSAKTAEKRPKNTKFLIFRGGLKFIRLSENWLFSKCKL
jgi:hypothetical protein